MLSPITGSPDICSTCGATLSAVMRHCPTCRSDAGAPNVRYCRTAENMTALAARYDTAKSISSARGCSKEFDALEDIVKEKSSVVISMPSGVARKLFEDPYSLYANYERLVGSEIRRPADPYNDRQRCAVGGVLFGSYADSIIYGALSLSEIGLPTYGTVYCRLRSVTIDKRTSFLETNSYKFVKDHGIVAGSKLPDGYMACWEDRHRIVLGKLADRLSTGETESDWQAMLIESDGKSLENDNFIEAHVYEGFDNNSVESLTAVLGKKLSKEEKLDLDLAIEQFNRLRGKTK